MKKIMLVLASFLLALSFSYAQTSANTVPKSDGWKKIGDRTVEFQSDKDEIILLGGEKFKSIQLKVKDAPIHIEDIQIFYEGGTKEDAQIRGDLKPGAESKVINLKNNSAEIKKVIFFYSTLPNAKVEKAEVELWGLK